MVGGWNKVTVEISDLHDMEDGASTTTVNNDADFEVAQCLRVGQTDEHESLLTCTAGLEDLVIDVMHDGVLRIGAGNAMLVRRIAELEPHDIMVVPRIEVGKIP